MKLIIETFIELGPTKFFSMISPAALQGASQVMNEKRERELYIELEKIYENIESGNFFKKNAEEGLREHVISRWQVFEKVAPLEELRKMYAGHKEN